MESDHQPGLAMVQATGCARLYETELVDDLDETLVIDDLDGDLVVGSEPADDRARHLELVRVVGLACGRMETESPLPIQSRLDALLSKLRKIKWDVVTLLLFGSAEINVPKRAKPTRGELIAFRASSTLSTDCRENLLAALRRIARGWVVFRKHSNQRDWEVHDAQLQAEDPDRR